MAISVFSYNLLSTRLADPEHHNKCSTIHLLTNFRWNLIKKHIILEISKRSIICLQELSEEWISILFPLFNDSNYIFVYDSQYLGVGIAVPRIYKLLGMDMVSIGERIEKYSYVASPIKPSTSSPSFLQKLKSWIYCMTHFTTRLHKLFNYLCAKQSISEKKEDDVWIKSIRRRNRYVEVNLIDIATKEKFNVYNYHMPCEFKTPDLMNIHAKTLIVDIQQKCGDIPYIIAGDFNSKPNSETYKVITDGMVPYYPMPTAPYIIPTFLFKYTDFLQSAYKTIEGKEPLYTNYAHPNFIPEPFRDTIDYIFFSQQLVCKSVNKIRNDQPQSFFPNEEEGSDHLPLGAAFSFKAH